MDYKIRKKKGKRAAIQGMFNSSSFANRVESMEDENYQLNIEQEEQQIRMQLEELLQMSIDKDKPLQEILTNGVLLCNLLNSLIPESIPNYLINPFNSLQMKENVSLYLNACMDWGLDESILFHPDDLVDGKDMKKVRDNLKFLLKHADQIKLLGSNPQEQYRRLHSLSKHLRLSRSTPAVSNIDRDLKTKEELKYNPELERMARKWIEDVLGEELPNPSLYQSLKSGEILCRFLNKIKPGIIPKYHRSSMSFKQLDNISIFLRGCTHLGLRSTDLFDAIDLYEGKNLNNVINGLHVLARYVRKLPGFDGPFMEVEKYSKTRTAYSSSLRAFKMYATWAKTIEDGSNFEGDIEFKTEDFKTFLNQKKGERKERRRSISLNEEFKARMSVEEAKMIYSNEKQKETESNVSSSLDKKKADKSVSFDDTPKTVDGVRMKEESKTMKPKEHKRLVNIDSVLRHLDEIEKMHEEPSPSKLDFDLSGLETLDNYQIPKETFSQEETRRGLEDLQELDLNIKDLQRPDTVKSKKKKKDRIKIKSKSRTKSSLQDLFNQTKELKDLESLMHGQNKKDIPDTNFTSNGDEFHIPASLNIFSKPIIPEIVHEARKSWIAGDPMVEGFHISADMNKKGMRKSKKKAQMEDTYFAEYPWNGDERKALFCVFDGHAGKNCALAVKDLFPKEFYKNINNVSINDFSEAFHNTYINLDKELSEFEYEGTTATTVFLWEDSGRRYIQAANVGDSNAYLWNRHMIIPLSQEHRPTQEDERKRLIESGIELLPGATRVGGLSVCRAFGDHFLKEMETGVIVNPSVSDVHLIDPNGAILIVASDGLWDVMSPEEAMEIARNIGNASEASATLLSKALSHPKCVDNITILVSIF